MSTALLMLAGTVAICGVVYLVRMGCKSIIKICAELNRDQRNGYKLNRNAPQWMEGDK